MRGRESVGAVSLRETSVVVVLMVAPMLADWVLRHRSLSLEGGVDVVAHQQDFGEIAVNRSVSHHPLAVGKKRYERGLGTHANSTTELTLPRGTKTFSGACGVDDFASREASVRFRVKARDGRLLFESPVMHVGDAAVTFAVAVDGSRSVILETDSVGDIASDHADWLALGAHE